jgi:hypothetical protein
MPEQMVFHNCLATMDEGGLEGEGDDDGPFLVGNLDNFVARKISKGGLIYVLLL